MANVQPYLRRFSPDDWQVFRSIRLEALQTNPRFFGSSYDLEVVRSDEDWVNRLADDTNAFWGLFDQDTCIGLTGLYQLSNDPGAVMFIASFIRPEYRRKGLSILFYEARIAWAREHGYKLARIGHRGGNEASRAANQKFGFQFTYSESMLWPDGTEDEDLHYQLEL